MLQIRAKMEEDSSVQLREFLIPEHAAAIRAATRVEDSGGALGDGRVPNRAAGIGGGWRAVGPTHKQRYLAYDPGAGADDAAGRPGKDKPGKDKPGKAKGKGESAGAILHAIREELFASEPFARLLAAMTNLRPTAFKGEVGGSRPGLDYTVAHHGILTVDPRLDATLCVVDDEGDIKSSAWDFGECGGFECYIAADEEGDAGGRGDCGCVQGSGRRRRGRAAERERELQHALAGPQGRGSDAVREVRQPPRAVEQVGRGHAVHGGGDRRQRRRGG